MKSRISLACMPLLALFAAACQDHPTGNDATPPQTAHTETQERTDGDGNIHRFEVDLRADGSFRPGVPIRLAGRVLAALPSTDVRISITLPEVRAAQRTGWGGEFYLPVGERMAPAAEWTVSMAAGERAVRTTSVTIPAPGVYRAVITATAEPGPNDPPRVQNVAHREIWIVVSEPGGRAVAEWTTDLVPAGMISEAGPFRARRQRTAPPPSGARAPAGSRAPDGRPGPSFHHDPQVDDPYGGVRVVYWNVDAQAYTTVPGAEVYLEYWDRDPNDPYGDPVLLTYDVQTTDANGYFWVDCSLDNYYTTEVTFSGQVTLANNDVDVRHTPYFNGGTVYDACAYYMYSYSRTVGVSGNPGEVYVNMNQVIQSSDSYFGISRGQIRVTLGEYDNNTSSYDYGGPFDDEEIKLDNDDVWSTEGVFTQAHEYGHAFHEKALGIHLVNACGQSHWLSDDINLQCAYVEGFADYYAAATMGSAAAYAGGIESNSYLGSNPDGSIVEGAVAAFLLDLSDPANELHDGVHYGGNYVARIVQTCRVGRYSNSYPADVPDGIDDLIYCFEQQVDPAVQNSSVYFTTRGNDADVFYETATEPSGWSATSVRNLWKKNLYNQ